LVERVEAKFDSFDEPVVIGFRENGSACIYFGEEPVFQFNSADQLRRVHDGYLFKAEQGKLVRLERTRQDGAPVLLRHAMSPSEQTALLDKAQRMMTLLASDLGAKRYGCVRQVPHDAPILERAARWLQQLEWPVAIADVPNAI
jgi:hypothetical protein